VTLQIFRKHPDADAYYVNGAYVPWAIIGREKRFSDAELAAEYYAAFFDLAVEFTRYGNAEPSKVLERFATHPHYDAQQL
jgi:hypothetical protein